MERRNKKYRIDQSPLYRLSSKKNLARLLDVDLNKLTEIVDNIPANYKTWYKTTPGKKDRLIEAPSTTLKRIQKKLCKLLSRIETPDWLMSGKKGVSYTDNADFHIKNYYFLCTDIDSFYLSCSRKYVFFFFKYQLEMPEDMAWFISDLVTFQEHIPTGAPTSQIIAYFAYNTVFKKIQKSAEKYDIKMSLYVDDITFSCAKQIPKDFINLIKKRLSEVSFKVKPSKTQFFYPKDYKKITGCCITPNNELKVPNKLSYKIINIVKDKAKSRKKSNQLFGLLNSARQIEPNYFDGVYKKLKSSIALQGPRA